MDFSTQCRYVFRTIRTTNTDSFPSTTFTYCSLWFSLFEVGTEDLDTFKLNDFFTSHAVAKADSRRSGFDLRPVCVGLVTDEVVLGEVFLGELRFPLLVVIPPRLHSFHSSTTYAT